ncbi:related to CDC7 - protein kinase [Ustilago trichophora]|uniref:non-specific serine/threonine protein kinase n=1 Tax=Ustilago trichophora TaxID=86804 RepID=A0A5C3DXG6_9BASI|nr:related to CDC7 - protein kinase [Ustilago trichophora]
MTDTSQQQEGFDPSQTSHQQEAYSNTYAGPSLKHLPVKSDSEALPSTSIPSPDQTAQPIQQTSQHQTQHPIQVQTKESTVPADTRAQEESTALGMVQLRPENTVTASVAKQQAAYKEPAQHTPRDVNPQQHLKQHPGNLHPEDDGTADEAAEATDDADEGIEETTETPIETSSEDARQAELIKLQEEIEDLETAIDGLGEHYQIVDRLGEGTFSSVYKAIDLQHHAFDNDEWVLRGPLDPFRKGVCHVALKKIYVTSSPQRIFNELSIMEDLRPAEYVSYLITAFRSEDQIVVVMPYSRHRDFRDYYKEMPLGDFKYYFRCLFSALQSVHEAGIMHRDIKPANFLYDPSTGHGTLCDFGLAERFEATEWRGKCHHTCPTPEHPHGSKEINRAVDSIWFEPGKPLSGQPPPSESTASGANSVLNGGASGASASGAGSAADALGMSAKSGVMDPPPERVGYLVYDARQGVRANRAGTRGFRAPEVLFKCQDQTVAIDIWSAGVILLTLLIRRFPVFNSNDDAEALLEIAVIFGKSRMEMCAMLHNRTFHCNIPTVSNSASLTDFINRLNPELKNPGNHPNPKQYAEDVANALDMVKSCLHVDCTRRKTAAELLQHPFLRMGPEEEDEMMEEDEYLEHEQDFADYYQAGDEHLMEAYHGGAPMDGMYEEDELEDVDENEYVRSEEVVQLQSRRGMAGEASETGEPVRSNGQSNVSDTGLQHQQQQHQQQPLGAGQASYAAAAAQRSSSHLS